MKKISKFTKAQLMSSKTLGYPVELVEAVLDETKTYTKEEAKKAMEAYKTGSLKKAEKGVE